MNDTTDKIIAAASRLSAQLAVIPGLPVSPAVAMGDPTAYCADYWRAYLARAADGPRRALIVGMNPGPHGMAQTGVPFGDVQNARRLLRPWLAGFLAQTPRDSDRDPPRPSLATIQRSDGFDLLHVAGLEYHRGEESGRRLWGALEQVCGSLEAALKFCLVINYCPLVFLDDAGRNVTPASWPKSSPARQAMESACDEWLWEVARIVQPRVTVGVGGYAEEACARALTTVAHTPAIVRLRHPNPLAGSAQSWLVEAVPLLTQVCGVDS